MDLSHLTPQQLKNRSRYGDPFIGEKFANMIKNATEEELLMMGFKSPAVHFACFTTIKDVNNNVISPVPNILQLRTSEVFETLKQLKIKIRIIEVKPRQTGCSTFAAHVGYHEGQTRGIEGITISDVKDHSAELLNKLREYAKTDSYPWENQVIQDSSHSLGWSNGTKWTVDTAENPDAGVGGTRQFGHFSEVSKWPQTQTRNDKKAMSAVLPSLSGDDTTVIAESTPEGAAGWHHDTWQEAVWLWELLEMISKGIRPEEIWVKVFAAWFEFDGNMRKQPVSEAERRQIDATMTDHERKEKEKYGLTYEQLAWRRDTIKAKCNGDPKVFSYYYPSDDISCWLASGSPKFDMEVLQKMKVKAGMVIPETGYLTEQPGNHIVFQGVNDGTGPIVIWERPQIGLHYLLTIDPASDASQTIGADPDRHSVSVWRAAYHDRAADVWRPAKKVARLAAPFYGEGAEVADFGIALSRYYGGCICAIEVNCGLHILEGLKMAGVPLYKRRPLSHRTGVVVEQLGFKMGDKQERAALIDNFATAIRTEAIEVLCPHTIGEYMTFVTNLRKGRAEADRGCHDDDVMADAIAWETLPSATLYQRPSHYQKEPADRKRWKTVNSVRRGF